MEGKRNYDTGYWAVVNGKAYWHRKRDGAVKRLKDAKNIVAKEILSAAKFDKEQALAHAAAKARRR